MSMLDYTDPMVTAFLDGLSNFGVEADFCKTLVSSEQNRVAEGFNLNATWIINLCETIQKELSSTAIEVAKIDDFARATFLLDNAPQGLKRLRELQEMLHKGIEVGSLSLTPKNLADLKQCADQVQSLFDFFEAEAVRVTPEHLELQTHFMLFVRWGMLSAYHTDEAKEEFFGSLNQLRETYLKEHRGSVLSEYLSEVERLRSTEEAYDLLSPDNGRFGLSIIEHEVTLETMALLSRLDVVYNGANEV